MKPTTPQPPMRKSRASVILAIISAVFVVLTVVGVWFLRRFFADKEAVDLFFRRRRLAGALCLILVCAAQVVVAFVPGELVEIASGYMFGAWGGALLCLSGILLGSCLAILLARRFGRRLVYAFYPKEKIDNLAILRNRKRRNSLIFLLFLIPGSPKDLVTYAIGLTDVTIPLYLVLTAAARFPSIIISSMGGKALKARDFREALIVFLVSAVVSCAGFFAYNAVSKRRERRRSGGPRANAAGEPADPDPDRSGKGDGDNSV